MRNKENRRGHACPAVLRKKRIPIPNRGKWREAVPKVIILLLVVSPPCLPGQTNTSGAVEKIRKYSENIDNYVESNLDRKRLFGAKTSSGVSVQWKEFHSDEEREKALIGEYEYQAANTWLKEERVVFVNNTMWSDSGDWALYVYYYFDNNGRTIRITSDFRTFIGKVKVLGDLYFDAEGKILRKTEEYFDLHTDRQYSKKPEYQPDVTIPLILRVADLPFFLFLKRQSRVS